jgi:hypothetical protein
MPISRHAEPRDGLNGSPPMSDLIFISVTLGFFLTAIAYTRFCQKLRGACDD